MLQRIDFNPYAYRNAPVVEGMTVVIQEMRRFTEEYATNPSFEDILAVVLHDPNDPRSRYQQAMIAQLAYSHRAKYYDYGDVYGKLENLKNTADTADYSGMSDAEKVMAIYDRYDQAFGDFRRAEAIGHGEVGALRTADIMIRMQFENELRSVFGSIENAQAAYSVAQYGNKSNTEIRAEIAEKYPPINKMTLREYYYMVWEMQQVGADDGFAWVSSRMTGFMDTLTREELLDRPLDISFLCYTYNTMRNAAAKTFYNDVGNSGIVLRELFGVSIDSWGNAYATPRNSVNYQSLIQQLQQKYYSDWTVRDFEQWFRSQNATG